MTKFLWPRILAPPCDSHTLNGELPHRGCPGQRIEGIGLAFVPKTFEREWVHQVMGVSDEEVFETTRSRGRKEGLLAGPCAAAFLQPEILMDAQRQGLIDALEELNQRADALFSGHTAEEIQWKPSPRGWSMAECVEHMSTSLGIYLPSFEAALQGGAPKGEGPFAYGPLARGWIRLVGPGGPKLPTPGSMRPRAGRHRRGSGGTSDLSLPDPDTLLADFKGGNDRLAELVRASEGVDLARTRTRSPVIPVLRFSLGAWFETCIQHSRRHMDQVERVSERVREGR